jgi:hypothetical protein
MTDAQRDELERLRMKAASPEMVTVPRALLACVLLEAKVNSKGFARDSRSLPHFGKRLPPSCSRSRNGSGGTGANSRTPRHRWY